MPQTPAVRRARIITNVVWLAAALSIAACLKGWYLRPYGPFMNLVLLGLPAMAALGGESPFRKRSLGWILALAAWAGVWLPGMMSAGGRSRFPTAPQGAYVLAGSIILVSILRGVQRRIDPEADRRGVAGELVLAALPLLVVWLYRPFLIPDFFGGMDAQSYAYGMADVLAQARSGVFPVLVGQSEFMFEGVVHPLRTAPYHQYLGLGLDLLSGRTLGPAAIQHLTVIATAMLAAFACLGCLLRLGTRLWVAGVLAALYVSAPAMLGYIFDQEMYMTFMAFGWLPLALYGNVRLLRRDDGEGWIALAAGLALVWYCHAPVGLWLTIFTGLMQGLRLFGGEAGSGSWVRAAGGAVLFGLLTVGYFWSVAEISLANPAPGPGGSGVTSLAVLAVGLACGIRFAATRHWPWAVSAAVAAGALSFGMHSYALWLGAILGLALIEAAVVGRWAACPWRERRMEATYGMILAGGLVAALLSGPPTGAAAAAFAIVLDLFPGNLRPVSPGANLLGDLQPGWALLLLGVIGVSASWASKRRDVRVLALATLTALVLYFPVPFLTRALLAQVPPAIIGISSVSLWLRYLPVLVGLGVFAGAIGSEAWMTRQPRLERMLAVVLGVACLWSVAESRKHTARGARTLAATGDHLDVWRPENVRQFAYFFPGMPASPYLVNGVADYRLESRLLDAANPRLEAVAPLPWDDSGWQRITAAPEPDNPLFLRLSLRLTLAPGEHRALRFRFLAGPYDGVLIMRGPRGWYREYELPEAGFGPNSFGVSPGRPKVVSIWNSGASPQPVEFTFQRSAQKPGAAMPLEFADVQQLTFDPQSLPVRTDALIPSYRATTAVAAGPALLEVPRAFIPGYRAWVNGTEHLVVRSPNSRVAVRVDAGSNKIEVRYAGTRMLWTALTISGLAWTGILSLILFRAWQRFRSTCGKA
ncbi:MAG: hypothetical protein RL324_2105 [Verrucomicrobiota bacterium]|jgi:hypothetical protein